MTETQEIEYGVRRADGKVQRVGGSVANAAQRAAQLNAYAKELGLDKQARIVKRRKTTVVKTSPWEAA